MELGDVDLLDLDRFKRGEHHEMFKVLRTEDPVHWTESPEGGFWSITKHADLMAVNRDHGSFSSEVGGVQLYDFDETEPELDMRGQIMLMTDPPKHTRQRLLVNKGFTPRMVGLLEQHLRYRAELIVDAVIEKGEAEFVTDLAAELPLQAIAEIMGVPQEERYLLFDWTNKMIGADDPEYNDPDDPMGPKNAAAELFAYAHTLYEKRVGDPKDDIVTKLINAEIEGERLSDFEFDLFILLLAVAGNETTRNATARGMCALLDHPEQFKLLRENPELLESTAVEEILRWSTPVMHFRRQATRDYELRDKVIKAGDKVLMWHISADRDEEVFDDPFTFDLTREKNDHIAFGGGGVHYCLGANLARMELRLIFHEIVTRMGDAEYASPAEFLRSNFIGGVKHIPIKFTPGPRKHADAES